jgi:hypothetical protein
MPLAVLHRVGALFRPPMTLCPRVALGATWLAPPSVLVSVGLASAAAGLLTPCVRGARASLRLSLPDSPAFARVDAFMPTFVKGLTVVPM